MIAAVAVLLVAAAILGRRAAPRERADPRPSTFLTSRDGASGLADALTALGTPVRRHRDRLDAIAYPDSGQRILLVMLDPTVQLSPADVEGLIGHVEEPPALGDLLLAGIRTRAVGRCLGYSIVAVADDSSAIVWPAESSSEGALYSRYELRPGDPGPVIDSSRAMDLGVRRCDPPALSAVDTLLRTEAGKVMALRLELEATGASVFLVADARVLRNRALRDTPAGEWALGLIAGQYAVGYEKSAGTNVIGDDVKRARTVVFDA